MDHQSGSYYAILPGDALNLGFDPYAVIVDEVTAQRDGQLWDAMKTAMWVPARGDDAGGHHRRQCPQSFAAVEHSECVRITEEPQRAPHRLVYVRNTPMTADPWDERN